MLPIKLCNVSFCLRSLKFTVLMTGVTQIEELQGLHTVFYILCMGGLQGR